MPWNFKFYAQIYPKVSVPWLWSSINEESVSLPKVVSNNSRKTIFSSRELMKIDQTIFSGNEIYTDDDITKYLFI